MMWMNFIPLLVWMMVMYVVLLWSRVRGWIDDRNKAGAANFYMLGIVFWLVMGGVLCL